MGRAASYKYKLGEIFCAFLSLPLTFIPISFRQVVSQRVGAFSKLLRYNYRRGFLEICSDCINFTYYYIAGQYSQRVEWGDWEGEGINFGENDGSGVFMLPPWSIIDVNSVPTLKTSPSALKCSIKVETCTRFFCFVSFEQKIPSRKRNG